jgi:hypothetical protein
VSRFALLSGLAGAVVMTVTGAAQAQDVPAADALLKRGTAAMKSGELEAACPAIAESQRLDPRPTTLFTLAECEAKRGHIATAAAHYAELLSTTEQPAELRARHEDRRKLATAKLAELEPRIPKLTLRLAASVPAGTEVRRDGATVGAASLGVALPVDPGDHEIVTRAPDGRERRTLVTLQPGDVHTVELGLQADAPTSPPTPLAAPRAERVRAPDDPAAGTRTAAYVVLGGSTIALGFGAVTGAMALGKKSTVSSHCVDVVCDSEGKSAADSGKSLALFSTIGFGVGLVGAGVGTYLLMSSRASSPPPVGVRVTPSVGPGVAGALMEGRW